MKCKCPECGKEITVVVEQTDPNRTKCPACGLYTIIDLSSINKRVCGACHAEFDWHLKPDQKSVLIKGLKGS